MSLRAIRDVYDVSQAIAPRAITATITGTAVDLANCNDCLIAVLPGVWTDGTHTPSLTDSDDNTTYAAVAAADLVGAFAAITATGTAVQKVSYIGSKRYIKPVWTVATGTTGMLAAVEVLTKTRKQP